MRSAALLVTGVMSLTIAAGATSASGISFVDSVKEFFGVVPVSTKASTPADQPDTILFTDDFTYAANSQLNGQGLWSAHSGAGTNPIAVTSPGLSYPGYAGSGIGNAVSLGTSGEDDNATFPAQSSGAVYAAAMVNVTSAQVTGDYFMHLFDGPIGTNIFRGRVFVKKDATNATYGFGLQYGSAATNQVYTPTTFATGVTHLIVLKYTFGAGMNDDTVSLFVDPALGGNEPTPTLTTADSTQADALNLDGIALRQGSAANAATETVDGIRVGTSWADVAGGGGGGTPSPSPTQSPGGGTPTPTPTPSPSPTPSPVASPSPTVPPVPFGSGDLVLYRVGDGTAALTNAATAVYLDEFTPSGAFVQSILMPTADNGATHILTASGTSTAEGMMTRSIDGNYLVLTGYDKAPGGANPSADPPTTTNRVVGRVAGNATVNTTTALNDPTTNVRSSASTNGTDIWLTASGNGIRYTTLAMTTSTQLATTPTNLRATAIFNGQLYVSSATGTFQGISTVGTGLPTTAGQTITLLNGFPTTTGPSPMQFAFLNANTLYVADDRAVASGGGIQKWTQSAGTWTLVNTFSNGLTNGCRGLTLTTNGGGQAVIYASTADSLSKLVTVTDDGTASPAFTTLATTGANTAWRGVAFAPAGGGPAPTPSPSPSVSPTRTPTPTPSPTATPSPSPSPGHVQHFLDFNGDGRSDFAVTRDSQGLKTWYVALNGTNSFIGAQWGIDSDKEVPADYDGDGKSDIAVFRDTGDPNRAYFYIFRSSNATVQTEQFGRQGDNAKVVGDWDGDGKADVAVFRNGVTEPCGAGHSVFFWRPSGSPVTDFVYRCWGLDADAPYAGDFDGDGRMDLGVIRRPGGQNTVYISRSSDQGFEAIPWGNLGDTYMPCDYDGDGKNDICIVRLVGSDARFYALTRTGGGTGASPIIFNNVQPDTVDQLTFGDYDGDGKTDFGILHASGGNTTFIYRRSSNGVIGYFPWGLAGDNSVAETFAGGSGM